MKKLFRTQNNQKVLIIKQNKKSIIMKVKQILMKSAWSIFKMQNVSFSQSLTLAWSKLKQGLKAVIVKSNKTVKSTRWMGYETIYFNELVFANIVTAVGLASNEGAKHDYGVGIYNGD